MDDPPESQYTTLDVVNQLQITALTVAVVVIWFFELSPIKKAASAQRVQQVETRLDAIEEIIVEKFGEAEWLEIRDRLRD